MGSTAAPARYGFWASDDSTEDWNQRVACDLSRILGCLLPESANVKAGVELTLPTDERARAALAANLTLTGGLRLSCVVTQDKERAEESAVGSVDIECVLPFHGAFLARHPDSPRAAALVWVPWLGEQPGFRFVRRQAGDQGSDVAWRLGLRAGRYVGAGLEEKAKPPAPTYPVLLPSDAVYPQWIKSLLPSGAVLIQPGDGSPNNLWTRIHDKARENSAEGSRAQVNDEDEIAARILVTFPVWLAARLPEALLELVQAHLSDSHARAVVAALTGKTQPQGTDLLAAVWGALATHAADLSPRLVPLKRLRRAARLQLAEPTNPVALASLLTQVRRHEAPGDVTQRLPASHRQNHPSFRKVICSFHSPESTDLGITLHLARGAKVGVTGELSSQPEDGADELGLATGLVPYPEHTDGARIMMGAKNLCQAMEVRGRASPAVRTGGEEAVLRLTKPLLDLGLCPGLVNGDGALALGVDLLVAYMPWFGMNVDDAIVVNQRVVEQCLLDVERRRRFKVRIPAGLEPVSPPVPGPLDKVEGGLAQQGSVLSSGALIAHFAPPGQLAPRTRRVRHTARADAVIECIRFWREQEWLDGVLDYTLLYRFPLSLGDKLMGRHGNKGVVGAIVPDEEMPRLPYAKSIPADLRGKAVDLVLNPHGVISRMNLGQLLETHLGWLLHSGTLATALLRSGANTDTELGRGFAGLVDHKKVRALLGCSGLDNLGRVRLRLPGGAVTRSPVVVGFQHVVRLAHIPEEKAQARRGGLHAAYDPETGQAVHGRDRGGGQRVGEMEVWALAAHQAHHNLEELLGAKADSGVANSTALVAEVSREVFLGFGERLRDWLQAILIGVEAKDDSAILTMLGASEVRSRVGAGREVATAATLEPAVRAVFRCTRCSREFCGGEPVLASAPRDPNHQPGLSLRDVLAGFGYVAAGPLQPTGGKVAAVFDLPLADAASGKPAGVLLFENHSSGTQIKAVVKPGPEATGGLQSWPKDLTEIHLYNQFYAGKTATKAGDRRCCNPAGKQGESGGNAAAANVLAEFVKKDGRWSAADLLVSCPNHSTVPLRGTRPFERAVRQVTGGLCDERVFGTFDEAARGAGGGWGLIELPVPVVYPAHVFLSADPETPPDQAEKRVASFLKRLAKEGEPAPVLPNIQALPVLPLRYRLPLVSDDQIHDDGIDADGYLPIIEACRRYREARQERAKDRAAEAIRLAVARLFAEIVSRVGGKEGLVRHDGLGRRVDRSARLVITPAPDLQWDEVGVPTAVLLELVGDEMAAWVELSDPEGSSRPFLLDTLRELRDVPPADQWSWMRSRKGDAALRDMLPLLERFVAARLDLRVLLNRQPSLHRQSIQAFRPVALAPGMGHVLRVSPLACKGFGADFDGDEMTVHIPQSDAARKEARTLLPSANLLSVASGEPAAPFEQDLVLGLYWLGKRRGSSWSAFLKMLPEECCRHVAKAACDRLDADAVARLLKHIAEQHADVAAVVTHTVMQAGYAAATREGASFGFYDVLMAHRAAKVPSPGADNVTLEEVTLNALERILAGTPKPAAPALHLAAMAVSGARGRKQVRQLVLARGELGPVPRRFDLPDDRLYCPVPLVVGLDPEQSFYAAMNARSSMCDKKLSTATAGFLTRQMVLALWSFAVTEEDCKEARQHRRVATCRSQSGCCAACHGTLPNGKLPPVGYPAGLIAAQSIGERGTQLSMQSFHTGARAVSMAGVLAKLGLRKESVEDLLDGMDGAAPGHPAAPAPVEEFVSYFKSVGAYESILDRHIEILWRVIRNSPLGTLPSAIDSGGLFTRVAAERQASRLLEAALTGVKGDLADPFARVLFNLFGARGPLAGQDRGSKTGGEP